MNIVVAGSGTAGLLVALYTEKYHPTATITVVYDDKIPIIGVGESTTPNFYSLMCELNIPMDELVKNTESTIKNGIKFTNWKGDDSHYFHGFTDFYPHLLGVFCNGISRGISLDTLDNASVLSAHDCVPYIKDEHTTSNYTYGCMSSYHFNAKLMAEYLQKVAVERGIKMVVGKIEDVVRDDDDYVTELILDTKEVVKVDFVYDCTGFSRLFAGKTYNSPLKSYEDLLPVKRAFPFFLDKTGETPPHTECIAMKYGWMWKIPVGKRYGCGYVFDSDLTTDEEAYKEICEITGQKPEIRKKINFRPEYYTKPFNKNTLALGLAHGFLEPLEATSLLLTIIMLEVQHKTMPGDGIFDKKRRDEYTNDYNKSILKLVENCVNFVHIHYLTPRNDTEFWKNFSKRSPDQVKRILQGIKEYDVKNPNFVDKEAPFNIYNFVKCLDGIGCIDDEFVKRNIVDNISDEFVDTRIVELLVITKKSKNHNDFLNELTNI